MNVPAKCSGYGTWRPEDLFVSATARVLWPPSGALTAWCPYISSSDELRLFDSLYATDNCDGNQQLKKSGTFIWFLIGNCQKARDVNADRGRSAVQAWS